MRNFVVKNDRNRAATHLDRSKEPQLTVDEGLLDYYAENAQDVAEGVYERVKLLLDQDKMIPCPEYEVEPLSEEDMKNRTLKVNLTFSPGPSQELSEFLDSLQR